ncbi:septum formation initiator family protein [Paenibacillus sp. MMS20-IR301]|uniref:FtsB family cell division protein n=1 Tax=Paenibacillus sp. MMS20-IR301 TaxID=2895946 RepID=UPI0028ECA198|nr:septum formation initiator family protein [Paenibacillus sp. MMS20-IR301]WNS42185.1 septum formation initiator family protein [Paenibacillus sp. MMS20-IR301]
MNRFSAEEKSTNNKAVAAGAKRRRLIWFLVVGLFFGWAGYTFFAQSAAIAEKSEQLAKKKESNESVTASLNQLKYEVSRLNDDEYIGQLARKWYNMYPEGELPIRTEQTEQ